MSRIGKLPIPVPSGVTVSINKGVFKATGPKGTLEQVVRPEMTVTITDDSVIVERPNNHRKNRAFHGLTRALINNVITGVSQGFERVLEINGVGYRAEAQGNSVTLNLGYSHPIDFRLPEGVTAQVDKQNRITIQGYDKQAVGQTAAKIRSFRPPEPYKGKGIKYAEETVRRKVGKSGVK